MAIRSIVNPGNNLKMHLSNTTMNFAPAQENYYDQHWVFYKVVDDVYYLHPENSMNYIFEATPDHLVKPGGAYRPDKSKGTPQWKKNWFRKIPISDDGKVYALESMEYPGYFMEDPNENFQPKINLRQASYAEISSLPADNQWGYFTIVPYEK